jgi:hypothetical protein
VSGPRHGSNRAEATWVYEAAKLGLRPLMGQCVVVRRTARLAQRRAAAGALMALSPLASICSARASSSEAESARPSARRLRLP